jgi:signal peptidase I
MMTFKKLKGLKNNEWLKNEVKDFLKDLLIVIVVVVIIRTFIWVPFKISGQSMYSSYYDKEFIIVDKISYIFWTPSRWDVIVFKPHVNEDKKYFLKRIIWVPWDTIKIEDGNVYIKPALSDDFILLQEDYLDNENVWRTFIWISKNSKIYELWENDYFVLWDNRNHSTDSRECFSNCIWRSEFISKSDMVWKVLIDLGYFNIKKLSFIHSNLWINTTPRFLSSPSEYNYWF